MKLSSKYLLLYLFSISFHYPLSLQLIEEDEHSDNQHLTRVRSLIA